MDAGKTNPSPGKTNPSPGKTNPSPGKTNPSPGKTNPPPGRTNPPSGKTDPPPGKTNLEPGSGNDLNLRFPTVLGKTYRVERSATLLSDSWTTVQSGIAGTGNPIQITDTGGSGHDKRFCRVVVGE
jgi:hypothetical protein